MKVAVIHDWLTGMRGGESVLEAIVELFPKAEIFTLICSPKKISPLLLSRVKKTSILQRVPKIEEKYRYFLPIFPKLIENFDLSGFNLILSSSHCVAKGIRKPPQSVHISYIHAPMRYMWDRFDDYFATERAPWLTRKTAQTIRPFLQKWDQKVTKIERIDQLLTNSHYIAQQINRIYRRDAQVIYPFADLQRFNSPRNPGKNYLMVTALVPYKRVDLAISAFNQLQLPLLIVGSGPEKERLIKNAGPTIQFLGNLPQDSVAKLYTQCKAFIFPGIEDFGITLLEAMAAGAPVIAFKGGGAQETVTEKTGIFFNTQTTESLCNAILQIEGSYFQLNQEESRRRAQEFSRQRFQKEFQQAVDKAISKKFIF